MTPYPTPLPTPNPIDWITNWQVISESLWVGVIQAIVTAIAVYITFHLGYRQAKKGWEFQKLIEEFRRTQTECDHVVDRLYELRDKEILIPEGEMSNDEVDYIKSEIQRNMEEFKTLNKEADALAKKIGDFEATP